MEEMQVRPHHQSLPRRRSVRILHQSLPAHLIRRLEQIASNDPTLENVDYDSFDDDAAEALGLALRERISSEKPVMIDRLIFHHNNTVSVRGVRAVASFIPGSVEKFHCHAEIGDAGAVELVRGLSSAMEGGASNNLKELTLCFCTSIGDEGLMSMANDLLANPCCALRAFNFNSDRISFEAWQAFGRAVRINTSITTLTLGDIDSKSACMLFGELKHNKSIETLCFGYNYIDDAGATALGELLKMQSKNEANAEMHNSSLKRVHLHYNRITDDGAIAIARGLEDNDSLELLDLVGNKICERGSQALLKAVKKNCTIKQLEVQSRGRDANTVSLISQIDFYCQLNRVGRKHIGDLSIPSSLWPVILAKKSINDEPGLLFWMLREKPDIFTRQDAVVSPRKKQCRKRRRAEL